MLRKFGLSHVHISGNVFIYRGQRYTSDHGMGNQQDHELHSISAKGQELSDSKIFNWGKNWVKADPSQVQKDMRTSRNPSNERKFSCKEWLTKSQIKNFSRLAASCCKENGLVGMSLKREEDVDCLVKNSERQELIESITHELGLKHPITYDTYDLCEYHHRKKLSDFNVPMLKNILCHLQVNFKVAPYGFVQLLPDL